MESPKSGNSMGYFCPKNTFLQLNYYIQRIYLPYFQLLIHQFPCHFWNHKPFLTTQLLRIFLAQTLDSFDKISSSKSKFSNFPLLALTFTKFFMSFFKQKVSFSSKFGSLVSVMRHNSSVHLFFAETFLLPSCWNF